MQSEGSATEMAKSKVLAVLDLSVLTGKVNLHFFLPIKPK